MIHGNTTTTTTITETHVQTNIRFDPSYVKTIQGALKVVAVVSNIHLKSNGPSTIPPLVYKVLIKILNKVLTKSVLFILGFESDSFYLWCQCQ